MTDPLKTKPTRTIADIVRDMRELAEANHPKPVPPQDAPPPPPSHHDSEESKP